MPIRFLRQPIHYSPDDSANPAPGGRSAAATGQPSSPGTGMGDPVQPRLGTHSAGSRPGFWGIFLGILDLLVALGTVVLLIVFIPYADPNSAEQNKQMLYLMYATAFPVVLGFVFGVRSMRGKKRSQLWSALYLVFVPLYFYLFFWFTSLLW